MHDTFARRESFAYRIHLDLTIFAGAGLLTLTIAVLTVQPAIHQIKCGRPRQGIRDDNEGEQLFRQQEHHLPLGRTENFPDADFLHPLFGHVRHEGEQSETRDPIRR